MSDYIDKAFEFITNLIVNVFDAILGILFHNDVTTLLVAVLFVNGIGFFLMYHDKKIAQKNGIIKEENKDKDEKQLNKLLYRRTPERTLIITALVGGSLGILGGMYKFRHKTQKPLFKYGVPLIIIIQIIFIIWRIVHSVTTNNATNI